MFLDLTNDRNDDKKVFNDLKQLFEKRDCGHLFRKTHLDLP